MSEDQHGRDKERTDKEPFVIEIYVCQRCGDELDRGDLDHNGRHSYCGGQADPNGSVEVPG